MKWSRRQPAGSAAEPAGAQASGPAATAATAGPATALSFGASSHEPPRSHTKLDVARIERRLRARAAGFVALLLVGVLVAGAVVRASPPNATATGVSGQLPSVTLNSLRSVDWSCPGPLPAGASSERSSVIVSNPGQDRAQVLVDVDGVSATGSAAGAPLPPWSERLAVAPLSEQAVALRTTGPSQNDAVSVLSGTGGVAVFESISTVGTHSVNGHAEPILSAPVQSPCSVGSATSSYLASGSTQAKSDVFVSLFDPTATQAVAGIRVSTGLVSELPATLQGLIIKPYSLEVFDVGRSVVQQPAVAFAVTTTAGRVAVGAYETVASDPTARTSVTGAALVIGIDHPQDQWVLTPGLGTTRRAVALRVYDPGSRPASVTVSSPVAGGPAIEETDEVPAGEVRAIELLAPAAGSTATGTASTTSTTSGAGSRAATAAVEGPIVVRAARGVGVVVSRIAVLTLGVHYQTVAFAAVTSVPADDWVLPAIASGTTLAGGVVVSNPGLASVTVEVEGFGAAAGAGGAVRQLGTLTVAAGASATESFALVGSGAGLSGVLVRSGAQVVVEQDFYALGTHDDDVSIAPVPVEGIPLVG